MATTIAPAYQFLDELGLQELIDVFFEMQDDSINNMMVDRLDTTVENDQFPSAKSFLAYIDQIINIIQSVSFSKDDVNAKIEQIREYIGITPAQTQAQEVLTHLSTQIVTGSITTVQNPNPNILYFQHDNINDKTWVLYLYYQNNWLAVGEFSGSFNNYWSKEETTEFAAAIQSALHIMTSEEIRDVMRLGYNKFRDEGYSFEIVDDQLTLTVPDGVDVDIEVTEDGYLIITGDRTLTDTVLARYYFEEQNGNLFINISSFDEEIQNTVIYPIEINQSMGDLEIELPYSEDVDLRVEDGYLVLHSNNSRTDIALEKYKFTINDDGMLIMEA